MTHRTLSFALIAALFSTAAVAQNELPPIDPSASADTRYCMKVGPLTGSNVERVRCWTRQQWADQGVDLDKEWANEGVKILA
jgi:hypothetical protein